MMQTGSLKIFHLVANTGVLLQS